MTNPAETKKEETERVRADLEMTEAEMSAQMKAYAEEGARMAESLASGVAGRGLFGAPYGTHDLSGRISATGPLPKPEYKKRTGPVSALFVPETKCPECLSQMQVEPIDQMRIRFRHGMLKSCSNSMTEFTRSVGEFIKII